MYLLPFALLAGAAAVYAQNPTVTLSSGVVIGTATSVSNQPTVTALANAYLGVPFAAKPTGSLRFAPPQPASSWSAPLAAQTLAASCLQQYGSGATAEKAMQYFNNPFGGPIPESEDCLYLNVYTPQNATATSLKPVMFWLFGGNLQIGSGSLDYYNGSSLAVNEDVVVVVPNYRTNIFGFSSSPQIPFGQQNSGLLDQRFALQWVQENVQAFGGDPTKVTLFGESAGGYSIKQLLANPPSPLPFRAAIIESQGESLSGNGTGAYNQVVANFGCSSASSPITCLRQVSATSIQTYINTQNLSFPPVLNDGTYSASDTLPQIENGSFAPVPVLIGTNKDEARVFLAELGYTNDTDIVEGVLGLTGINISSILDPLLANYSGPDLDGAYLLISRIATDLAVTCTTSLLSSAIAAAGRQPVWRYRFDAAFPDVSPFANAGAYHTSEIPEVWGTFPLQDYLGDATATQVALSRVMQGIWAGFARDPAAGPGWPKLGSNDGVELGELGGQFNESGEATRPLLEADYPCVLLDPLILAGGGGY